MDDHYFSIERPLIFFDLEGTGKYPNTSRIVQIGMVKYMPDGTIERKNRLINPEIPIPLDSTEVHGITDEMVKDEPRFKEISKSLFNYINGCDFGGFNIAHYDLNVLRREFKKCNINFDYLNNHIIDVYLIEKVINRFKKMSYSLRDTYFKCNGEHFDGAHDAIADVMATVNIFEHQLNKSKLWGYSVSDVIENIKNTYESDLFIPKKYNDNQLFIESNGQYLWNFGKNKGRTIDSDMNYVSWFLGDKSPFDKGSKEELKQLL
jgi:DNA polymerase-3 subunit epsilon